MKNRIILTFVCTIFLVVLIGWENALAIELLDGDIIIHGKASQQLLMRTKNRRYDELHDYEIYNFRSTLKLETRWHALRGSEYELTFYGVWKNFYDTAHELDRDYYRYVNQFGGSRGIEELKSYETFRDICRELYVELTHPNWQVRLGKQIVSWGETSFERMADVVNPIDMRGMLNPGYPDFAEIKRGLWMARFYITPPDFFQDITFEFLVIPDFQPNRNWPAGYHLMHPSAFNSMKNPNDQFKADYRDRPKSWRDPAFGFKIRGFSFGFDWSLQYLYHRNPVSIIREGKAMASALPALLGRGRAKNVKRYGHQSTIAFTFNKTIDKAFTLIPGTSLNMSGNVARGEFVWEIGKDNNQLVGQNVKVRERNRYAFVLGWDTYIQVPWLSTWNRNRKLSSSTQLFNEWVPDKHRNDMIYPWVTYRKEGHHFATITQSLSYDFWNSRLIVGCYGAYHLTDGAKYYTPQIAFKPTFRWTYMVRYLNYVETGHNTENLDAVTFDITYEF